MYFPSQPPIGGRLDPVRIGPARPPFGWGGWGGGGWNGVPRPENTQVDPNQPPPEPPRPNQPNNAGTMPGAASPGGAGRMRAADQVAAWNEANPGIHRARWGDLRQPGRRQQAMQQAQAPLPTPTAPVSPPVPPGPVVAPPVPRPTGSVPVIPGMPSAPNQIPPMSTPGQSGQYGGINPGGGATNQIPSTIGGIPGQSGQYGGINPGGQPQAPIGAPVPGGQAPVGAPVPPDRRKAGMQLSAMEPWGQNKPL